MVANMVSSKPTNHSKFMGKCGKPCCPGCHLHPACKSKDKTKGTKKHKLHLITLDDHFSNDYTEDEGNDQVDIYHENYSGTLDDRDGENYSEMGVSFQMDEVEQEKER
ncbi:hypothetical protein JHK86_000829 [Glycine max]|nr:hypothetical protein JHK86_000829 [Glycine max]